MILSTQQWLALGIFGVTYFFIATGSRERTIAAMAGAGAMFAFGILKQEEMIQFVNFEALSLLFGMMVVVGVLREAAFFRWLGIHLSNLCQCRPKRMLLLFVGMTAFLSAFLDNVTTVLFMVVVTIEIVGYLKINPVPFIISEIIASNIGGTGTLIGDPPNIMIATATGLSFRDFLFNTGPIAAGASVFGLIVLYFYYRKQLSITVEVQAVPVKAEDVVQDRNLFRIGIVAFSGIIVLFFLHDLIRLAASTIAVLGAILLLFVGGPRMREILEDVEWGTLLFFASLFIVVGGLEKTDIVSLLAAELSSFVGTNELLAITTTLWVAAFASSFIDNIPFVAAFIPLLQSLTHEALVENSAVWWALALGAGFGGNGTAIGASPNIVATGIARKMGYRISFVEFTKIGFLVLLVTVAFANLTLYARFLLGT
jgi:Na+/H+ antiporter NhaD/arsenite permease-like protein